MKAISGSPRWRGAALHFSAGEYIGCLVVEGGLGRDLQRLVEEFKKDVEVSGIFLEFHERDTIIGLTYCRRDELAQSLGVL